MTPKLKQLYQEVILHHNKIPIRYEEMADGDADAVLEAYNPICGDRFKVFLKLEGDKITHASFHGYGCAISKASCSIMVETIQGLSLKELPAIFEEFDQVILEDGEEEKARTSFQAFAAAKSFPGRLQCVTLGWEELKNFTSI